MVTLAIVLMTLGMLVLPTGRFYMAWKRKQDPTNLDKSALHKIHVASWIISNIIFAIGLVILLILQK